MQPSLTPPCPLSTRRLVSADGQPAALHDFGGEGPALLLSHGNGLNAGMWRAALPHLTPVFHCYGLDLRGHGACRPTDPDYSVDRNRMADDVFAALDALGEESIRFAAHSLGGASAVFAAVRHPERFKSLWLFEPVVVPDDFVRDGSPSFLVEAARRRRMEFDSVEEALRNFLAKAPFDGCDPEAVRGYVELGTRRLGSGGVRLSCEGEDEARVFESGQPLDFARLSVITCPIVVACGQNSDGPNAIPAEVAPLIAAAIPGAVLEVHGALTHFGPMEAGEEVAKSIIAHCS